MINSIHDFGYFLKKQKLLQSFVEVGVAEGRSSLEFMNWGFKKCYLIDIWEHRPDLPGDGSSSQEWHDLNYRGAQEKMKRFGKKVTFLKGESKDMVHKIKDGSQSFIYLDGNHSYEGVKNDLEIWTPKLKDGGIMAMHDFNDFYQVKRAAIEFCNSRVFELHKLPEQSEENAGAWFQIPKDVN